MCITANTGSKAVPIFLPEHIDARVTTFAIIETGLFRLPAFFVAPLGWLL